MEWYVNDKPDYLDAVILTAQAPSRISQQRNRADAVSSKPNV